MNARRHAAFTLIELLVVTSIIGFLSSIVIASLNQARIKANQAAAQSNLDVIRTQAALYYDTNGSYSLPGAYTQATVTTQGTYYGGGVSSSANCNVGSGFAYGGNYTVFADPTIKQALAAADKAAGGTGATPLTKVQCQIVSGQSGAYTYVSGSGASAWTVWVPASSGTSGVCVDSNGKSEVSVAPTSIVATSASAGCP